MTTPDDLSSCRQLIAALPAALPAPGPSFPDVRALTFDVFGIVVDWRGSIIAEGSQFNRKHGVRIDWANFADGVPDTFHP